MTPSQSRRSRGRRGSNRAVAFAGVIATTILLMGLALPTTTANSVVPRTTCHAGIASVSPINASNFGGTVTIRGHCFGKHPRFILPSSYYGSGHSGEDTLHCGNTTSTSMSIFDNTGSRIWEAGIADNTPGPWSAPCSNVNGLGLNYYSWNNTTIVFHGFGNRLQTCASSGVSLCKGDHLQIRIFHPYTTSGTHFNMT